MRVQRALQQLAQLQHLRDTAPVEHAAHQHQNGERMRQHRVFRTFLQRRKHQSGVQRGKQNAGVLRHSVQQGSIVAAAPEGIHGVEHLPVRGVPAPIARPAGPLPGLRERAEDLRGAGLHHVVEAIGHAVRKKAGKGVLRSQRAQQLLRFRLFGDKARHFRREFIGKTEHGQKFPCALRQRVKHGGREHGVDIRISAGQRSALGQRAQIEVDGGEPALRGGQKRGQLRLGQRGAAAAGIDGQLLAAKPELLRADPVQADAQTQLRVGRQKAVAPGNDEVDVFRQAVCKRAQEIRDARIGQQVKVVEEEIARLRPGQPAAQAVRQKPCARGIDRAVVVTQEREPGVGKGLLRASPENGKVGGIDADADTVWRRLSGEKPVDGRRLAVAHGCNDRRQRTAGDRPQALLQPPGNIDRVKIMPDARHPLTSVLPALQSKEALRSR